MRKPINAFDGKALDRYKKYKCGFVDDCADCEKKLNDIPRVKKVQSL